MGSLSFLTWPIQLVLKSRPGQLAALLLEKTAQVSADAFEAVVVGRENKATSEASSVQFEGEEDPQGQPVASEEETLVEKPEKEIPPTAAQQKGLLVRAARLLAKQLRCLQNWLRALQGEAPPTDAASPPTTEGRRRLVARKRLDELGFVTRVFRSALYALTDTLDSVGIRVSVLEYAKGTLHVSGDKSIDCSPVKDRSAFSPNKRKECEDSEDEEEEYWGDVNEEGGQEEPGTLEQLNKSYNSEDDEDYQPPPQELSTDSEEYKEGQTESEESGQSDQGKVGAEGGREAPLPPRRSMKPLSRAAQAKPPSGVGSAPYGVDKSGAAGTPVTSTTNPPSETKSVPEGASHGVAGKLKSKTKDKGLNVEGVENLSKLDQAARKNLPASDRTS